MSKQTKRLFNKQSQFSIRKFTTGVFSVAIGHLIFVSPLLTQQAFAAEETSGQEPAAEVVTETVNGAVPVSAEKISATESTSQEAALTLAAEAETTSVAETSPTGTGATATTETPSKEAAPVPAEVSPTVPKDVPADKYKASEVIHHENVVVNTTDHKREDLSRDLEKVRALTNATVHLEFKAGATSPTFYNLFSISSQQDVNQYFTLAINNGVDGNHSGGIAIATSCNLNAPVAIQ